MIGKKVKQSLAAMTVASLILVGTTSIVNGTLTQNITYAAEEKKEKETQVSDLPRVEVIGTGGTISGK
jgi:L-asparaginase/Glu-tRNA(Gln) amidotransferase subunit D